jgi:hypothetical protein
VVAARAITSKPTPLGSSAPREDMAAAAEQPVATPPAAEAPVPAPAPLADAGAEEVRNEEPPPPADSRASPSPPPARVPKAKRAAAKSSAPEDLIAPDYAK